MNVSEAGRLGALKTNKILTAEMRKKAAKKGWAKRKKLAKFLSDNSLPFTVSEYKKMMLNNEVDNFFR